MARPRTRHAAPHADRTRASVYGVQFTYRGESHYVHFGGTWEGWDDERGAGERRFLMEKVNRGEWAPPPSEPGELSRRGRRAFVPGVASEWLHRQLVRAGDPEGAPRPAATSAGA